jgi:hypothetical protein
MCTQNQGEKLEIMLGSEMHALSRYTFFVTIFGAVSHMAHTDACAHVCGHTSVAFSSSCIFCLLFALIVHTPFYGYIMLRTTVLVRNLTRLAFLNAYIKCEGRSVYHCLFIKVIHYSLCMNRVHCHNNYIIVSIELDILWVVEVYSHKYMPGRLGRLTWLVIRLWPRN